MGEQVFEIDGDVVEDGSKGKAVSAVAGAKKVMVGVGFAMTSADLPSCPATPNCDSETLSVIVSTYRIKVTHSYLLPHKTFY